MSSPYRDGPIASDDELMPEFKRNATIARQCLMPLIFGGTFSLGELLRGDRERSLYILLGTLATIAFCVVLGLLIEWIERPISAWLDRRYARVVAKGIAELEAKAARS